MSISNPTELKDKLIATERFTEPHYQRAAERYVQTVLRVLAQADLVRRRGPGGSSRSRFVASARFRPEWRHSSVAVRER
jgi:hypothetical protein